MSKPLFRQKSLDKIASPEQMGDYIRVSNPSVWMILAAIIALLVGVCVWGIFGRLDSTLQTAGVCKDRQLVFYIRETDFDKLSENALVSVDEKEYTVSEIAERPLQLDESFDSYLLHRLELSEGDWVYAVKANTPEVKDGIYAVVVITESVRPMDFVSN